MATHPVGAKDANDLGLYDMSGNLYEWCWDWYDADYYDVSSAGDPTGPSTGYSRVLRGGSWSSNSMRCRSADRTYGTPSYNHNTVGFRVARR